MSETATQFWDIAAPFVAAGLAAWLTYLLSLRQRRAEILIEQRLGAFNAIQSTLVGLLHYCEYRGRPGDDIGPSLPEGVPIAALGNAQRLSHCIDANRIYLSSAARSKLLHLRQSVAMAASMELAVTNGAEYEDSELYIRLKLEADACIEFLHGELGLPGFYPISTDG